MLDHNCCQSRSEGEKYTEIRNRSRQKLKEMLVAGRKRNSLHTGLLQDDATMWYIFAPSGSALSSGPTFRNKLFQTNFVSGISQKWVLSHCKICQKVWTKTPQIQRKIVLNNVNFVLCSVVIWACVNGCLNLFLTVFACSLRVDSKWDTLPPMLVVRLGLRVPDASIDS